MSRWDWMQSDLAGSTEGSMTVFEAVEALGLFDFKSEFVHEAGGPWAARALLLAARGETSESSIVGTLSEGETVSSTISTSGEEDWYEVELVAGQSYIFTLTGGPAGLSDPFLTMWQGGDPRAIDDDGGPGRNSVLTFTALESGTHYISAHAFSSETGDYTLSFEQAPAPALTDPLDWGTKVEGTELTVYFAGQGETHDGMMATRDWSGVEKVAVLKAWASYAAVTGLSFSITDDPDAATFTLVKSNQLDADTLGYFNPPGTANAGVGVFNYTHESWTVGGLQPGGYAFVTLVHEFGHALGLAHPHDNGGTSSIMQGVLGPFDDFGPWGFNQGVFTTMSYNDGVDPQTRDHFEYTYGWQATPGALDIALLQEKYGVNSSTGAGNDIYYLEYEAGPGSFFSTIWDSGGVDAIAMGEGVWNDRVYINLNAATLQFAEGGAGYVSAPTATDHDQTGFVIAHGVVIENAYGGAGMDTIDGNAVANEIHGNGGNDTLRGHGGNDRILGGEGSDHIYGGDGNDYLHGGENDTDWIYGGDGNDIIRIGPGSAGHLYGDAGHDHIVGGGTYDRLYGGEGDDIIFGRGANDQLHGEDGADKLLGQGGDDFLYGGAGEDKLVGHQGDDRLDGGDGFDRLFGGLGNDTLTGGGGADVFVIQKHSGHDLIEDFELGQDKIHLVKLKLQPGRQTAEEAFDKLIIEKVGTGSTLITLPGEDGAYTVRLKGIDWRDLTVDDFIFKAGGASGAASDWDGLFEMAEAISDTAEVSAAPDQADLPDGIAVSHFAWWAEESAHDFW